MRAWCVHSIFLWTNTKGDETHCSNCVIRKRKMKIFLYLFSSAGRVFDCKYVRAYIHIHSYTIHTNTVHIYTYNTYRTCNLILVVVVIVTYHQRSEINYSINPTILYVCIYVCIYVYMYVCIYFSYVCMYVYMYVCIYFSYVCMYVYVCVYILVHIASKFGFILFLREL